MRKKNMTHRQATILCTKMVRKLEKHDCRLRETIIFNHMLVIPTRLYHLVVTYCKVA